MRALIGMVTRRADATYLAAKASVEATIGPRDGLAVQRNDGTMGEPLGWIGGINRLAWACQADHFIGLNDDVICHPGWVDALLAPLADPSIGITGFPPAFGRYNATTGRSYPVSDGEQPDYIEGWCFAMRTADAKRFGPYDASFPAAFYYDDVDLCLRLRAAGLGLAVVRPGLVDHIGNATFNDPAETAAMERAHLMNWSVMVRRYTA